MKWLHNLLKGVSLSGALFVFQACYGVPQSQLYDYGTAQLTFAIVSGDTNEPLSGIRIQGKATEGEKFSELGVSGSDGRCVVEVPYSRGNVGPFIRFEDPGDVFAIKDTTFADLREREIAIKLLPRK